MTFFKKNVHNFKAHDRFSINLTKQAPDPSCFILATFMTKLTMRLAPLNVG